MERRVFLKSAAGMGAGSLGAALAQSSQASQVTPAAKRTGRLKQSVTLMCFGGCMEFEETCRVAASLGFKGYDYLQAKDFPTLKKYGLVPSMSCGSIVPFTPRCAAGGAGTGAPGARGGAPGAPGGPPAGAARGGAEGARGAPPAGAARGGAEGERGAGARGGAEAGRGAGPGRGTQALGGVQTGPNVGSRTGANKPSAMEVAEKENHDEQEKLLTAAIDEAALNGAPNIIIFAGYRTAGGMSDQEAADNCVAFLNRIKARAEDKNVNICMEYLNSRVNHRGYFFDKIDWGVDIMKRVNSPRVGILYDIYHAQVDEGDVVRTIRNNIQWIKHLHTAGNPGRKQLDDDQELNWRFIARAIADLNYDGFVGHEYMPTAGADPVACLKQAFEIFNV